MTIPIRVLVCGGRSYADREHVFTVLDRIHAETPFAALITGDAVTKDPSDPKNRKLWTGADWFAIVWAAKRGVWFERYEADWKTHGRAAGPIRNQQMLDRESPELVIAFPGGRGTEDMVTRAREARIDVRRMAPRRAGT